ncbi:hypothetical protein AB7C87_17420 [Natrarchaeobius sp. A-rgal3]|uniref:DUF7857 domain-containing protein n=1 Tax=Natrarchaeobius versutus TaxID=1679078 RepID=UPI00350EE683
MVTVETNANRVNGVTTVRVVLANTHSTPQTVRLRSCLEGPVWPPRTNGVPDPRWDENRWESTIRPGRRRGVGFATPAPPTDPLVEVVSSERHDADEPVQSPETVLADLEDWCPTSDVLEREL